MRLKSLLLFAAMASAQAQDRPVVEAPPAQAGTAPDQVVRVTGLRAVPWKSYRALLAAQASYDKHRQLAPDSIFRYAVMAEPGKTLPPNFQLRVRTRDGEEYPVALENGELFQLPGLPDPEAHADLVSNFKGGELRIGLLIHTLSVPPEQERLGDARLRCEVSAAIADVDDPSRRQDQPTRRNGRLQRKSQPYCSTLRARVLYQPRAATSSVTITDGSRREALAAYGGAYRIPVQDQDWSNDAIITFQYKTPMRALHLSEVAVYQDPD